MRFRRRAESDFQAEIESHIRIETDRLIAEGMPPEEAEAAARRAFGNITIAQEKFYVSQRRLWWDELRQDVRYGGRSLRKTPAFTAAAALTIALGIGANTAIFSLVEAVLLRSLPVQNPKELVFLETAGSAGRSGPPPYPCFMRLRDETGSFAGMAAFAMDEQRVEIDGLPEQVMGQVASGNYFRVLGLKPPLGRLMDPGDENLNPPVAVISDQYWRRRFGADPSVIGKAITLGKQPFTIIGVTPHEFRGLQPGTRVDVTTPITTNRELLADAGAWWLHGIVARLKTGVPDDRAQAESNAVFRSFMAGSPQNTELVRKHWDHLELRSAAQGMDDLRRRFSMPLYVLMGIVGMVLLMAIANITNLLLARGTARRREFALRLATGAGRARLMQQLLTETLLLFALGMIPGVLFAGQSVGRIEGLFAEGRRAIALEASLNWRVLVFSMTISLVAGILAGLFPAWRAFRTEPEAALREGQGRTSESRGSARLTRTLVALQVAISLVLLVAAVTFVRTLINLRNVDPGFRNEHVVTMSVGLPDGYVQAGRSLATWSHVLQAVREIPGIRSAALSNYTPLSGRDRGALVRVPGYQPTTVSGSAVHYNHVSEGYFETLGIPLIRGRTLTGRDAESSAKVALINQAAAHKFFAGRDPLGQTVRFTRKGAPDDEYRIVGVIQDTKHQTLREAAQPFVYVPIRQPRDTEHRVTLIAASAGSSAEMALVQPIRSRIAKLDPGLLISDVISMRRQLDTTLLTERLLSALAAAFGVLALILASVGLYGILSYRIGQQRRSIGIRMALGASPASVAVAMVRQSGLVVAMGLLCGLPFALFAARAADSMMFGLKSSDPAIYLASIAVLCLSGFVSTCLPARRASSIDPAEALRSE